MRSSIWIVVLVACKAEAPPEHEAHTTSGAIALANLDHQIAQAEKQGPERVAALVDLLLAKSQFTGDYQTFDRAVGLTENAHGPKELRLRARVRGALHRFGDALADLEAAGGDEKQRATIFVATGRASEVVGSLEEAAKKHAGYAQETALGTAYAALGRFDEADAAYEAALRSLRTTSPFPYAWVYFTRGVMWSERAGDKERGAAFYRKALAHLPQYVQANVHLAELGDREALERLRGVDEPEAIVLLGRLTNDPALTARAKARYEELLVKYPLAFADHAAEFYLGSEPGRAYELAMRNLENRETERSLALAIRCARAAGKNDRPLVERAASKPRTGVELRGLN